MPKSAISTAKSAAVPASVPLVERFEWQCAALAILVVIAYANSLGSSFHFDDYAIFKVPAIVSPGFGWGVFRLEQTRPLTYLTFHWNYLLDGQNPTLYHLINIPLHAANSILVLAIARKYVSPLAAGCVAVVFALHPLQTESVTYVYARSTLLSTHLALWAIWLYLREKYLASALLFGVSLLAKEETIALPAFLLLLELFRRRRPKAGYFALLTGFAALAAGRLFYLIATAPTVPGVGRVRGVSTLGYLMTQCRMIWIYLRLMIVPIGLNLDRDAAVSKSLLVPWTTLAGAASLAILLAGLIWLAWQKRQPAALWALGFFVLIAPSSSIVAQADMIYEHRTNLAMVCAVIALGFLLERVPRAGLMAAFAVLVPVMLFGTISRNADWSDEKTFWTDAAAKSPNKGRVWLGLAQAYASDPAKASEYLRRGLAVDPDNAELHTSDGIALLRDGQSAEALAHFQRAMALTEPTADGWNNIGGAYYKMNNLAVSLESFEQALRLDSCSFNVRRNLMMLHSQAHEPQAVWQAGQIPATCVMLPDEASELERLRRMAGKP